MSDVHSGLPAALRSTASRLPAARRPLRRYRGLLAALVLMAASSAQAIDKDLQDYAAACEIAIPKAVPSFNCLDGTIVPMQGTEGGTCDAPPYLPNAGCYKYSRIGDLGSTDKVGLVFMCRHKKPAAESSNLWQDIAVIQTNFETGATCFFQQLDDEGRLSGEVTAPSQGRKPWITPRTMALEANACVQCHDSGALLRTPYLKAVQDTVPAFAHYRARGSALRDRYWFPGGEFLFYESGKNWNGNVLRVRDSRAASCTSCHAMGVSNIDKAVGTSTWLGPFSTGAEPTPFLQGGAGDDGNLAFWMRPNLTAPADKSIIDAQTLRECARLPHDTETCVRTVFGGQLDELGRLAQDALSHSTRRRSKP